MTAARAEISAFLTLQDLVRSMLARNPHAIASVSSLNWAAGLQHLLLRRGATAQARRDAALKPVPLDRERELAGQFAYYMPFADLAYENKSGLLRGLEELSKRPGGCDLVSHRLEPSPYRPVYLAMRVHGGEALIVSVAGTNSVRDALVDADCLARPFLWGYAHAGFARSAENLLEELLPVIQAHVTSHPLGRVVLVGHSMGAGVAALMTLLLRHRLGVRARNVSFAPPATVSPDLAGACYNCCVALVNKDDFVPSLSEQNILKLLQEVVEASAESAAAETLIGAAKGPRAKTHALTSMARDGFESVLGRVPPSAITWFDQLRANQTTLLVQSQQRMNVQLGRLGVALDEQYEIIRKRLDLALREAPAAVGEHAAELSRTVGALREELDILARFARQSQYDAQLHQEELSRYLGGQLTESSGNNSSEPTTASKEDSQSLNGSSSNSSSSSPVATAVAAAVATRRTLERVTVALKPVDSLLTDWGARANRAGSALVKSASEGQLARVAEVTQAKVCSYDVVSRLLSAAEDVAPNAADGSAVSFVSKPCSTPGTASSHSLSSSTTTAAAAEDTIVLRRALSGEATTPLKLLIGGYQPVDGELCAVPATFLFRPSDTDGRVSQLFEADLAAYSHIVLSPSMFTDHLTRRYTAATEQLTAKHGIDSKQLGLPGKWAKRVRGI